MVNMDLGVSNHPSSPLIQAAKSSDLESLRKLLEKGADVFETGLGGGTVLHFAVDTGTEQCVYLQYNKTASNRVINVNTSYIIFILQLISKVH